MSVDDTHLLNIKVFFGASLKELNVHLPSKFIGVFCFHHFPLRVIVLISHFQKTKKQNKNVTFTVGTILLIGVFWDFNMGGLSRENTTSPDLCSLVPFKGNPTQIFPLKHPTVLKRCADVVCKLGSFSPIGATLV